MKKSDLKNGTIVKSSGGRWGVVVMEDATDKNCIKFLYDPNWLPDHGYILEKNCCNVIVPLDDFEEDMTVRWTEETEKCYSKMCNKPFDQKSVGQILWRITSYYEIKEIKEGE